MKNDNKIDILRYRNIEIIGDKEFIERIKDSKRLKEYANLELMRENELQKVIQSEKIDMYNESLLYYSYKQYRIYLNLYEELYMDYSRDNLN